MSFEFIQRWWLTSFIVFAVLMYFFAYAGFAVQNDAKKRGLGKAAVTFWSVSVIFFGPIFLPLYAIFRSRAVFAGTSIDEPDVKSYRLCPHCGEEISKETKICGKCHKAVDLLISTAGASKVCPYCGADNPIEAIRCKGCDQVIGYVDTEED